MKWISAANMYLDVKINESKNLSEKRSTCIKNRIRSWMFQSFKITTKLNTEGLSETVWEVWVSRSVCFGLASFSRVASCSLCSPTEPWCDGRGWRSRWRARRRACKRWQKWNIDSVVSTEVIHWPDVVITSHATLLNDQLSVVQDEAAHDQQAQVQFDLQKQLCSTCKKHTQVWQNVTSKTRGERKKMLSSPRNINIERPDMRVPPR